jgi:hypothetical protein
VRKAIFGIIAASLIGGCSSEKPLPPDTDPAAQEKAAEAHRQLQKELRTKGAKEGGIPKEG